MAIHATSPVLNEAAAGAAAVGAPGAAGGIPGFPLWPLLLNQAARFSVPAFFILAGLFTAARARASSGGAAPTGDPRRRLARLAVPYLTWSVVFAVLPSVLRSEEPPPDLAWRFLFGWTFTGAYFLMALIQLTIVAPILVRLAARRRRAAWIVCGLAMPAVIAAQYLVAPERLSLLLSTCVPWLPFFFAGVLVGMDRDCWIAWMRRTRAVALIAVPALLGLEMLESLRLLARTGSAGAAAGFLKITAVGYAVAVVVLALGRPAPRPDASGPRATLARRLLSSLAGAAYAIFLIHGAVILHLRDASPPWWRAAVDSPAGPLLLLVPAIGLPWGVYEACRRVLPNPFMLWLFGERATRPQG